MAAMEKKEEIHVLMVAFSSQGHINHMLRLAKRLLSKGLDVTLATTEVARHRMLTSSSTTTTTTVVTVNSIDDVGLAFFSNGLNLDYDLKTNLDHYMPFIPWAADVAAEHGIPCALLWIQPCSLYSIYYRFYNHLNQFPSSANPNMSVELPGLPLLNTEDLPSFVLPSNPFGSFPKLSCGLFQNMKKMKWVLANSFHELESQAIDSMFDIHLDGVVTNEEVDRRIEDVMCGPEAEEFRENAAELKVAARVAVADGGSSDRNIQLFVDEILGILVRVVHNQYSKLL
ncbi:UDP-glycosyltransferase 84B1 [Camellia lanceoleosa]|uniref:UDP-glycosyltransferase 84B1 n=1 Tax=Camellia lanceoleosa TaxID=1840588 RepID=A0ACC0FV93_9ERIC|nr:UDP-glycosyltransferase 84B1 [Camellia lanceoleosa]